MPCPFSVERETAVLTSRLAVLLGLFPEGLFSACVSAVSLDQRWNRTLMIRINDYLTASILLVPLSVICPSCASASIELPGDDAKSDTEGQEVSDRPTTDSDTPSGGGEGDAETPGNDSSEGSGSSGGGGVDTGDDVVEPDPTGTDPLRGYWVWESRIFGDIPQSGPIDTGQMKVAFGTGNDRCHYVWNETTGSDFHTRCTYSVIDDMVTFRADVRPDGMTDGYSCAHPDWNTWNDRPAVQWSRFRLDADHLWLGVNTYWGFGGGVDGVPNNGSLKRFPFWESEGQARTEEAWIVFRRVTREEWFTTYAISTRCQGSPEVCATLEGCGPGDHPYVD